MAKQCSKCGNYLLDDEKFCTRCGTNVNSNSTPDAPQTAPVAAAPQPQYQQYQQPQNQQPVTPDDGSAQMTVGSWVGTIILTTWFGLISIILLFVWGFGANVPKAKANYCKAMLIFELIAVVISILFIIIFSTVIIANAGSIDQFFESIVDEIRYA